MPRVLISATEPSADRLGAELVAALRSEAQVEVIGLGGPAMRVAGVAPLAGAVEARPAMGVVEVLAHLGDIATNARAVRAALDGVDLFVPIDAPDFHVPLAAEARRRGVPVCGYVSPQVWAWRAGRIPKIAASMDRLLCLFAFEPALYAPHGLDARWVGHPVVDRVPVARPEPGVLAIFPGSRSAELRRHLAVFCDTAARLDPARLLVASPDAPSDATRAAVDALPAALRARTSLVGPDEALARAERALTKSGTVTLELALAGVPAVVAHRVHPLTYAIGRLLVRGVRHLALPNILLGREVVPEYVQRFDVATLAARLPAAEPVPRDALAAQVGEGGAALRAARAILELL